MIKKNKADLGIAVDPDVDRLVFFDENGEILGEEIHKSIAQTLYYQLTKAQQFRLYLLQTH